MTIYTDEDAITLERYDSAWLDAWESHRVENIGDKRAGLDVFAPGRSFDFWLDRETNGE